MGAALVGLAPTLSARAEPPALALSPRLFTYQQPAAADLNYRLSDTTHIGIDYRPGRVAAPGSGFRLPGPVSQRERPESARLGLYHQFSEQLALDLTLGWDNWNALDQMVDQANALPFIARHSRGTSDVAVGLEYVVTPRLMLTADFSYDRNTDALWGRTPSAVLDPRLQVGVGGEYELNTSLSFRGYLNYLDADAGGEAAQPRGYDKPFTYQMGVSARWNF
ncbi:outer membrane protein transport protein [Mangrovimicrobium sediminis]|uniref:outer membrane protein transport protein n=1 Tax=Mangrovimicrobium sediminis TaxID=2562682 RepID=UPI001436A49D|nr:outer membrane protein transport protein [Haliea sp. SAOS-164]